MAAGDTAVGAGPLSPATGEAVARSGLLSMVALAALGGTRLIHGSLVSRATDHETFALVGTLIGVAMASAMFLPGGLASAASKFVAFQRARGNETTAEAVYRGLRRVGYLWALTAGLVTGVGTYVVFDLVPFTALSAGLLVAAFSLYSVEKAALYGFGRTSTYVKLELVGSGVAVGLTVIIVGVGSDAYLWPLIVGYSLLAIGATLVLRRRGGRGPGGLEATERREIAGYVAWASVGGLAGFGFLQALPVLAARFTTPAEVSYFVAAVALVAPLYFLPRALGMALFPALAHAHGAGDIERVRRHTDASTRALIVLLAPVFAVGVLVSREVLMIFGGARYAGGLVVLQLLLVATYFAVSQVAAVNALSSGSAREVRIPVLSAVSGCTVGLIAAVPLGLWWGATGVAVAYVLALVTGATRPVVAVWRRYHMPWAGPVIRSLVVVAGAFAVARVIDGLAPVGGSRIAVDLIAALGVGTVAAAFLGGDIRAVVRLARRSGVGRQAS